MEDLRGSLVLAMSTPETFASFCVIGDCVVLMVVVVVVVVEVVVVVCVCVCVCVCAR